MGPRSIAADRLSLLVRAVLLLVGLSTYLIVPDDVVWHFIKTAPHPRVWEHVLFGVAAAILGSALLLKVKAGVHGPSRSTAAVASLLQAIGIGSLLPLPGFLLLVLGDGALSLLLYGRHSTAEDTKAERDSRLTRNPSQAFRWRDALAPHIGLCFAFVSMAIFSVVLIDRVADALFAMTAVVSIAVNLRRS